MPHYNIDSWGCMMVPAYGTDETFDEWLAGVIDFQREYYEECDGNVERFNEQMAVLDEEACPFGEVKFQMVWSLNENEEVWRTINVANLTCRQFLKAMFELYRDNESGLGDHIHFEGVSDGVAYFGS